jgi:DNA polymerase-3 subunit epsilon
MKLQLRRPIVIFDLETTGINITHDRIIEISIVKVWPGREDAPECKTFRVNPGMPIPADSTAVHHITDADVADLPTFDKVAYRVAEMMRGCDIAGFNSNRFDIPLLDEEFSRAGVDFDFHRAHFIDVQTIFHKMEPRNLSAAYRFYCGKELVGAHGAQADTMATFEVLLAQVDKYDNLPADVDALSEFSSQNKNVDLMGRLIYDDKGREVINFGKYKGRVAAEVMKTDPGYYSWIKKGDFPSDTKRAFDRIRLSLKK